MKQNKLFLASTRSGLPVNNNYRRRSHMGHRDATYVIFDGDNDRGPYAFMRGWRASEHVDFDFRDAHELGTMTANAQNEQYVKRQLRARMEKSSAVVVLVGDKTKWLYKYVR